MKIVDFQMTGLINMGKNLKLEFSGNPDLPLSNIGKISLQVKFMPPPSPPPKKKKTNQKVYLLTILNVSTKQFESDTKLPKSRKN